MQGGGARKGKQYMYIYIIMCSKYVYTHTLCNYIIYVYVLIICAYVIIILFTIIHIDRPTYTSDWKDQKNFSSHL